MLNKSEEKRNQIQMFCIEDLVPKDHLLRKIERAIEWNFIYELVEDKYSVDNGRPSINPVTLIKIPIIQYLYGIKSMRQTIKEIEVNVAYRWFLGLDLTDKVPHFSTFGKNYVRRFKETDIFKQIFSRILEECIKQGLVNPKEVFVDATHVKACANNKKVATEIVKQEALFYEGQLEKEINFDRSKHKNLLKIRSMMMTITITAIPHREGALKRKNAAQAILKAVGFIKVNINRYLHIL